MADETYQFNRKLRYIGKTEDYGFTVKYTIDLDPSDANAALPSKNSTHQIKVEKTDRIKNDPEPAEKRKSQQLQPPSRFGKESEEPATEYVMPKVNHKKQRKRYEIQKLKEFQQQEAELFNNIGNLKAGKKKKRRDSLGLDIKQDKKYKKKEKYYKQSRPKPINITSDSQQQLEGLYHHMTNYAPEIRRRQSQSIDHYDKAPTIKAKKQEREQAYHDKKGKKTLYQPYLDLEDIEYSRDNNQNKYFKGVVDFAQKVKNYARIFTKQVEGELIAEGTNKNRCLHGDEVYFEIIPKEEQHRNNKEFDGMDEKTRCKVVYIIPWRKNESRKIVGKIEFTNRNKTFYLVPINKRIVSFDVKFSQISKENLKKLDSKYFLAEFTGWKQNDQFPSCRVLSEFGAIGEIETETAALLISNGVEDKQYDEDVVKKGLAKFLLNADEHGEYKIPEEEIKKRADLRKQRIFTIDPLTARDFDDALSISQCEATENGKKVYEIGVHIADASFFVEQGGPIDDRAQMTTTSVYLVHRVLPMLPRVLCETMCSLNPGLERLTLSVWFKITEQGTVLPGNRYDRSVIKSVARFTYEQAQKIIKGEAQSQKDMEVGFGCVKQADFEQISKDIKIMNELAVKIRAARLKGGSLIFQTPKKTFQLNENLYPQGFTVGKRFQAHYLVQQYMLLANQKVGQILVDSIPAVALLRRHKFPTEKKIEKFQQFTVKINNPIKINRETQMQQQMNQVMNNPKIKQCIKDVLNYQMIFLLEQAEYFIVADTPRDQWLHYALNMPVYTHFTSPIRRYPDIMVHRQLIAIIQARKQSRQVIVPEYKKLKEVVDRCNKNKMSAKKVSSGCEKIFLCLYLKTHPVFCKAVLTDLNQYCLSICVPSYDFRTQLQFKQLKKARPLQFAKDSNQRKFVEMEFQYEPESKTKIFLKEMQEIDIKLTAKQGFPIDYMIRVLLPHPKTFAMITLQ